MVKINRCSLVKLPLRQDYTVVHYSSHYVALSLLWQDQKQMLDCLYGWMKLIIFEFVCSVVWSLLYFLILGMLQSCFRDWGQGGNIC